MFLPRALVAATVVALAAAFSQETRASQVSPQFLSAPEVSANGAFGVRVDLDGDTAIVAAPGDSTVAPDGGRVVVFERQSGVWARAFELFGAAGDALGGDVVLDGDVALVARAGPRPATVLRRLAGVWGVEADLPYPGQTTSFPSYGTSMKIEGDRIAIGSFRARHGGRVTGAVYVFERTGGSWALSDTLLPQPDPVTMLRPENTYFGLRIGLSGDTLAVGIPRALGVPYGSGAIQMFERGPSGWSETQRLTAPAGLVALGLGQGGFDLQSGRLAASAVGFDVGSVTSAGIVHVFESSGGPWAHAAWVENPFPTAYAAFGQSLALDGDRMAVGRSNYHVIEVTGDVPVVDVFSRGAGGAWSLAHRLQEPHPGPLTGFGDEVALCGTDVLVGAASQPVAGLVRGAVYSADLAGGFEPISELFCEGTNCPCPPRDAWAGCANSLAIGGKLVGSGSRSVFGDDLELTAYGLPPGGFAMLAFTSNLGPPALFGHGSSCLVNALQLAPIVVPGSGTVTEHAGLIQRAAALHGAAGVIVAGQTFGFQMVYDDVAPFYPCPHRRRFAAGFEDLSRVSPVGRAFNVTNGVSVTFAP